MKTLFKSVFAVLVALFLAFSLPGCFDEGSKTASQGGGAFGGKGVSISIPKFNQEKNISLDFSGPSISKDAEIEAFYREVWSSIGHSPRKESLVSVEFTMYITTKGGVELLIPEDIVKKLHGYKLRISGRDYVLWTDGMEKYYILPIV